MAAPHPSVFIRQSSFLLKVSKQGLLSKKINVFP
jgi:hypothetical protein